MAEHGEPKHSKLGASGSHRWLVCAGSVAAQSGRPNPTNEHSARGTAAHQVADECLKNGYDAARFHGDTITIEGVNAKGEPISFDFEVDDKMVEDVQYYLDICRADVEPGDLYWTERKFDLTHIYPGMFGTSDWTVYKRKTRRLIVRDYKNGFGLVDHTDNPQTKYYGVGALREVTKLGLVVDEVTLGIVQPNAPHIGGANREWTCDAIDLIDFEMELLSAAKRTEDPNAPRTAGDHCEYCLAAHDCPALTAMQQIYAASEFDPVPGIEPAKIAQLLNAASMMEARISAAWAYAQAMAESGVVIPGFKLGQRNTRRKLREPLEGESIAASIAKEFKLADDELYTQKLKTPAQIEKSIKAPRGQKDAYVKRFNDMFVTRPVGGYVLVREVDPRPALTASNPQSEFEVIDGEKPALLF